MKDILMDLAAAVFTQVQTVTEEAIGVECPLCKPLFNFHENLAGLSFKNSCQITEGIMWSKQAAVMFIQGYNVFVNNCDV